MINYDNVVQMDNIRLRNQQKLEIQDQEINKNLKNMIKLMEQENNEKQMKLQKVIDAIHENRTIQKQKSTDYLKWRQEYLQRQHKPKTMNNNNFYTQINKYPDINNPNQSQLQLQLSTILSQITILSHSQSERIHNLESQLKIFSQFYYQLYKILNDKLALSRFIGKQYDNIAMGQVLDIVRKLANDNYENYENSINKEEKLHNERKHKKQMEFIMKQLKLIMKNITDMKRQIQQLKAIVQQYHINSNTHTNNNSSNTNTNHKITPPNPPQHHPQYLHNKTSPHISLTTTTKTTLPTQQSQSFDDSDQSILISNDENYNVQMNNKSNLILGQIVTIIME